MNRSHGPATYNTPQVAQLLQSGITEGLHVGVQVCVSIDGRVVHDTAIGQARPQSPLTRQSLVLWKSSGKPVTVVALMQLVERGRVCLEDAVARFIPEFARHGKEAVTIKHLLTHTGGFRDERFLMPDADWDTIIKRICDTPLENDWVPGATAGYHALTSWFVLGEIVQRVSGRLLGEYVREYVFEPLGMSDCWIQMPSQAYDYHERQGRLAALPDTSRDEIDWGSPHAKAAMTMTNPGGGMAGPAHQMVRVYEMFLGSGEREGSRVLEPESVGNMTARHRADLMDRTFGYPMQWGLGLILEPPDRKGRPTRVTRDVRSRRRPVVGRVRRPGSRFGRGHRVCGHARGTGSPATDRCSAHSTL